MDDDCSLPDVGRNCSLITSQNEWTVVPRDQKRHGVANAVNAIKPFIVLQGIVPTGAVGCKHTFCCKFSQICYCQIL